MNILALDTSTEYLSLALHGEHTYTRDVHAGQSHSQQILPLLRELLDEAGTEVHALDGIAFGAGPGSFTGLRIGCGVAQGLAFGAKLPVVGISTLLALAQNTASDKVIACLDARMGEVYHATYERKQGDWMETSPPALYKPDHVPLVTGSGWTGVGTGWVAYGQILGNMYGPQLADVLQQPFKYDHPRALSIAQLALPMFAAGLGRPAAEAAPVYIRNKVALKTSERVKP